MAAEYRFGAPVHTSDGREVGRLERLVVDGEGLDPHSIVIRESDRFSGRALGAGSAFFEATVIVPTGDVAEATPERVTLAVDAATVRRLPPYLSYRYRALDALHVAANLAAVATSTVSPPSVEEIANKRPGELEVSDGENVMLDRTGRRLGHVRELVYDGGELVGVVMHPSGFFRRDVFVPVRFLARSDDLALFLDLSEAELEQLKPVAEEG